MNILRTMMQLMFPASAVRVYNSRKAQQFRTLCSEMRRDIAAIETPSHVYAFEQEIRWIYGYFKGYVSDQELIDTTDNLDCLLKSRAGQIGADHCLERLAL